MHREFATEKSYIDFLILNSDKWINSFFGDVKVRTIKKEWYIKRRKLFGKNLPRMDIFLELEDGRRVGVEVKKPTQVFHELVRSLSQLLAYEIIAEENDVKLDEIVLITNQMDDTVWKVIKKYKLPIRVFVITKEIHGEYKDKS